MTGGTAWLAEPRAIAFGGYSVLLARGIGSGELAERLAHAVHGPARSVYSVGELTSAELIGLLDDEYDGGHEDIALRHGEDGGWAFVVLYGDWAGGIDDLAPVSRDGAHVFHLEFEEENGKPVPPQFRYVHDGRLRCAFNLHLDHSWGSAGVEGDPEVASPVMELLTAAGLPDETVPHRVAHRTSLEVLERHFGLTLPRTRILDSALPAAVLEVD
ncbi:DUF6461 domain-containing protein [Streptomyces sp. NPDC056013]|uniref:DUF6461 domain-containing protein n=1 Tax=Streptomyces sp. NPDC056013 TaxID=3345680 RepID=UPI0035DAF82B